MTEPDAPSGGDAEAPGEVLPPSVAPGFRSGFVAIVGRPNVGKSTLLNALVGEKVAIVSAKPQTTRRRILGIVTTATEQVIFVDTPGIHVPRHDLGRYMVKVARQAIPDADVVLWVVDVSRPPTDLDRRIAAWLRQANHPVVLAMNKSDRLDPSALLARTESFRELVATEDWILTIATAGHNLDRVWRMVVAGLPEGPAYYPADQVSDQTDRMLVAELVREAALRLLHDEVPHGVAVMVTDWQRRENGVIWIAAQVVVERERHKAIVIGDQGRMLKRIGTTARRQIERLVGTRVFLELEVRARADWRRSAGEARELGYQ